MPARTAFALILALIPGAAPADPALVASRTLRAAHVIGPGDLTVSAQPAPPGFVSHPDQALGMEARVTLYAGRPIPLASLAPPALVERNQLVTLVFRQGGLEIRADGRALARGGPDESIRVMNLASRNTLSGRVAGPGLVFVP
jgi:flagellar basal body P-ring formation protein FlgA